MILTNAKPLLLIDKCYSEEHKSVQEEQIVNLSHNHTLYMDDNALAYKIVDETLRRSSMVPIIQSYKKNKDGRAVYFALKDQHV